MGIRAMAVAAVTIAAGLMAAVPCSAAIGGLLQVPTADVIERGAFEVGLANFGAFGSADTDTILESQFGLTSRLSAGLDLDPGESDNLRGVGNVKYLLAPGTEGRPGLAVGIYGAGARLRSGSYLTVTDSFGSLRGHIGFIHFEDADSWFVGIDRPMSDRLLLEADYISGEANGGSAGLVYTLARSLSVEAGVLFPNEDLADTGFVVNLVTAGSFSLGGD